MPPDIPTGAAYFVEPPLLKNVDRRQDWIHFTLLHFVNTPEFDSRSGRGDISKAFQGVLAD